MSDTANPAPEGAANVIETDYTIGQHNITRQLGPFNLDIHNPVLLDLRAGDRRRGVLYAGPSGAGRGALRLVASDTNVDLRLVLHDHRRTCSCWFSFVLASFRRLGKDPPRRARTQNPDYTVITGWLAMLFAAGVGIGLMFFGVLGAGLPTSPHRSPKAPARRSGGRHWPVLTGDPEAAQRAVGMAADNQPLGPACLGRSTRSSRLSLALFLPSIKRPAADPALGMFYPLFGKAAVGAGSVTSSTR